MKFNYKKLGELIEISEEKNKELTVTNLVGMNINKEFMPSVANTIGTNLSRYKIIKKDQFAYNNMQVGRDRTIRVARYSDETPSIISPAYKIFEIIDKKVLNAEFLMLYFLRSEFDRLCWFYTDSSVRGSLDWSQFCDIEVPVPPIEIQLKIVEIYNFLNERINLKHKINNNLFSQGQLLFDNYILKKYDDEQPQNWKTIKFSEISTVQNGYAFKSKDYCENGCNMIRTKDIDSFGFISNDNLIKLPQSFYDSNKYDNFKFERLDTITVMVGASIGKMGLITDINIPSLQNQNMWRFRPKSEDISAPFIYYYVKKINKEIINMATGSARSFYRKNLFLDYECILPNKDYLNKINSYLMKLFNIISNNVAEIDNLEKLRDTIIPKLMAGEINLSGIDR